VCIIHDRGKSFLLLAVNSVRVTLGAESDCGRGVGRVRRGRGEAGQGGREGMRLNIIVIIIIVHRVRVVVTRRVSDFVGITATEKGV